MNITLDIELLKLNSLKPSYYIILYHLKNGYKNLHSQLENVIHLEDFNYLALTDYVRLVPDEEGKVEYPYALTGKGLALFEEPKQNAFIEFIDLYRALFPKGVKSGNGTPIRGDKTGIIKKMTWFLQTYPEFSKATILEATKIYIEQMRRKGFTYITQADYLIEKNKSSKLAALCEEYDAKNPDMITSGEVRL
jgi:hypothetical protein